MLVITIWSFQSKLKLFFLSLSTEIEGAHAIVQKPIHWMYILILLFINNYSTLSSSIHITSRKLKPENKLQLYLDKTQLYFSNILCNCVCFLFYRNNKLEMRDSLTVTCLLTILCNLPLSIGNFYFFFNEPDSSNWASSSLEIDINMKQWLGISAFTQSLYILVCCFFFINRLCSDELDSCTLLTVTIIKFFNSLFMLCWLIAGSLIKWNRIGTNYTESLELGMYLQIMIIIQYLLIAADWTITVIYMKKNYISDLNKIEKNDNENKMQENQSNNELIK